MSRPHRYVPIPLLPAPPGARFKAKDEPKRKQNCPAACSSCRARKSRCDGLRPQCIKCSQAGTKCQYSPTVARSWKDRYQELLQRHSVYEGLVEIIKSRPESEALEAIRRIKRGTEVASILGQLQDGPLLMQLSSVLNVERNNEPTTYGKPAPKCRTLPDGDRDDGATGSQDDSHSST
ncbi:hypothetical protein ACN47E_009480 [Coniothyrium glycines]